MSANKNAPAITEASNNTLTTPNIPEAFKPYKKFMVYKLVPKANGKTDKVPINPLDPHNRNPEKYEAFNDVNLFSADDATVYAEMLGAGHGVGFYFTDADPFFFVDIDGAYEAGQWSPVATDLCNRFNGCYVEVSQSGTGLHIFGTGTPPADHANKNVKQHLELYTRDRFVALTGTNATGDAATYVNGELISAVNDYFTRQSGAGGGIVSGWTDRPADGYTGPEDDDELLAKIKASKPNAKKAFNNEAQFADLFDGNMQLIATSYPPESISEDLYNGSSADIALANYFSFWTGGNCERIERLMRRSALVREKWDSPRGKTTWLRETILESVKSTSKFYSVLDTDRGGLLELNNLVFVDVKGNGTPKQTARNLETMLQYADITVRYNVISKKVEVMIPNFRSTLENKDNSQLAYLFDLCAQTGLSKETVNDQLLSIADKNLYNPVADWITAKQWDEVDRFTPLLDTLGVERLPIYKILLRRFLISGAMTATCPNGHNAPGVLVLQGPQNLGKTRWLRRLFGGDDWFRESAILDPKDKDSVLECLKFWGVELGELDATFKRADIAALKGFLTKDKDIIRVPYGKLASEYPRRTIFCASVNQNEYLRDPTGNRRFWSIECGPGLNANHDIDIQQVWAQAHYYGEEGERYYLDQKENAQLTEHNLQFEEEERWASLIIGKFNFDRERCTPMTTTQIAEACGEARPTKKDLNDIGVEVRKLLNVATPRRSNGQKVYNMPERKSGPF